MSRNGWLAIVLEKETKKIWLGNWLPFDSSQTQSEGSAYFVGWRFVVIHRFMRALANLDRAQPLTVSANEWK